jgi:membrane protein implicated in regulation of membrane protease activity
VRIGDEVWNASAASVLEVGAEVEVVSVSGLRLAVRPPRREE